MRSSFVTNLVLEGIGVERPAMTEHDRLSGAPILVVNLGSVLGGDVSLGRVGWLVAFDGEI
jgi:hypothetical protein